MMAIIVCNVPHAKRSELEIEVTAVSQCEISIKKKEHARVPWVTCSSAFRYSITVEVQTKKRCLYVFKNNRCCWPYRYIYQIGHLIISITRFIVEFRVWTSYFYHVHMVKWGRRGGGVCGGVDGLVGRTVEHICSDLSVCLLYFACNPMNQIYLYYKLLPGKLVPLTWYIMIRSQSEWRFSSHLMKSKPICIPLRDECQLFCRAYCSNSKCMLVMFIQIAAFLWTSFWRLLDWTSFLIELT